MHTTVETFPRVLQADGRRSLDCADIDELRRGVLETGAVILRGYSVDLGAFARLAATLCDAAGSKSFYGASKSFGSKRVYGDIAGLGHHVQGVDAGNHEIPPHAENSFFPPERPDIGLFWMKTPASARGRTTIVDGRALYSTLKPATRKLIDVLWIHWNVTLTFAALSAYYGVTSRDELEERVLEQMRCECAHEGIQVKVACDDWIGLRFSVPVLSRSSRGTALATSFGFGSRRPLNLRDMRQRNQVPTLEDTWIDSEQTLIEPLFRDLLARAQASIVRPEWLHDDVLVIDNWTTLHGRESFKQGDCREVLTSWGKVHWLSSGYSTAAGPTRTVVRQQM